MTLFHLSLLVSVALLFVVLIGYRYIEDKAGKIMLTVFASLPALFFSMGSNAVLAQSAVLVLVTIAASLFQWTFRPFIVAAAGSSFLIYALFCFSAFREIEGYRELRERMTMELVSERIPPVKKSTKPTVLPSDTNARLDLFEVKLQGETDSSNAGLRNGSLEILHWKNAETFVNSSGFGVYRMTALRPQPERIDLPMSPPIPQPAPLSESDRAFSLVGEQPADGLRPGLSTFHLGSLLGFVNVRGFGLLTEEKRLFGFQPHHFRKLPDNDEWQVRSLELVGLIVHDEPRVYETKELPRMDKIRDIPTRSLDAFEAAGLESFKAGEDLYARTAPLGVRMLGAIRSVEQCLKCHGGERGDLLGAFSYSLQKKQ